MSQPADIAADLARRVKDLRAFEAEYRAALQVHLTGLLTEVGGTSTVTLDDETRWQVEEARSLLAAWDRERNPDGDTYGTDRTLADQVRALLGVLDRIAPKGDSNA